LMLIFRLRPPVLWRAKVRVSYKGTSPWEFLSLAFPSIMAFRRPCQQLFRPTVHVFVS
jgi:hypothetical protein